MTKISFVTPKDGEFFEDKVKFEEVPSETYFLFDGVLYLKNIDKYTGQITVFSVDLLTNIDPEFLILFEGEEVQPITVLKIKAI